jgi:hypothetical protein
MKRKQRSLNSKDEKTSTLKYCSYRTGEARKMDMVV